MRVPLGGEGMGEGGVNFSWLITLRAVGGFHNGIRCCRVPLWRHSLCMCWGGGGRHIGWRGALVCRGLIRYGSSAAATTEAVVAGSSAADVCAVQTREGGGG